MRRVNVGVWFVTINPPRRPYLFKLCTLTMYLPDHASVKVVIKRANLSGKFNDMPASAGKTHAGWIDQVDVWHQPRKARVSIIISGPVVMSPITTEVLFTNNPDET